MGSDHENDDQVIRRPPSFDELVSAIKTLQGSQTAAAPEQGIMQHIGNIVAMAIIALAGWVLFSVSSVQQSIAEIKVVVEGTKQSSDATQAKVDQIATRQGTLEENEAVLSERVDALGGKHERH